MKLQDAPSVEPRKHGWIATSARMDSLTMTAARIAAAVSTRLTMLHVTPVEALTAGTLVSNARTPDGLEN